MMDNKFCICFKRLGADLRGYQNEGARGVYDVTYIHAEQPVLTCLE